MLELLGLILVMIVTAIISIKYISSEKAEERRNQKILKCMLMNEAQKRNKKKL